MSTTRWSTIAGPLLGSLTACATGVPGAAPSESPAGRPSAPVARRTQSVEPTERQAAVPPASDEGTPDDIVRKDPTRACQEREPVVEPPGYEPRDCALISARQQSAHDTPYLLWDFDFRFFDYAPCPGYRYAPSHLSLVEATGRVAFCVQVPGRDRERRLDSTAVDNHRLAPWNHPVVPWRLLGRNVALVYSDEIVRLDAGGGRLVDQQSLAGDGALPPFDSATLTFRVGNTKCMASSGPSVVIQDCADSLLVFWPRGVCAAIDPATGRVLETLRFRQGDVRAVAGRPEHTAKRVGKRFEVEVATRLFLH